MLFLTNFQQVNGSFMKTKNKKNGHPRKLMTLTKTIFKSLSRQTVFLQNLFNHVRLYSVAFLILLNPFFKPLHYYCISPNKKVRFAQVLAFSKVAKIESEVFVALRASQGDLEPSRATISPQSSCILTLLGDVYFTDSDFLKFFFSV